MSRRRAQKQQEKEEFLEANPELISYQTQVRVVEAEQEEHSGDQPSAQSVSYGYQPLTRYEAEATSNGEDVDAFTGKGEVFPDLTLADFVGIREGSFASGAMHMSQDGERRDGERGILSLSEDGFGVAQIGGFESLDDEESDEYGPDSTDFALNGDETIVFSAFSRTDDETDMELGSTGLEIDYTVLSGRGTVEITLIDRDNDGSYQVRELSGDPETVEATSAFLRSGQDGSLEAEMAEGVFDMAIISVTGNLEIAVVGFEVTSNTDAFFVN